jgi:parallel beta-helix repeat protein
MVAMPFLGRKYSNLLIAAASIGAVFAGGIGSAQATTYYVSALTGNDHNSGKATSSPFKTIGAITGSDKFTSGDIVVVMPGTYNENVTLSVAGKAGAYTTLMAEAGAARPVIVGGPNLAGGANGGAIGIFAPYTRVTGFDVSWQGTTGDAITVWGETAKNRSGVVRPAVHHLDIEDNVAHDSGCGGIDVINADYVTVIGNTVYNNAFTAPNQCSGITLYELTDYDSGAGFRNTIAGNMSFANFDGVPVPGTDYTTDGNGIIIDDSRHTQSDNAAYHGATLVYGNVVFANGGVGIQVFSSDNVTVANNTAFQNQQSKTIPGEIGELRSQSSGTTTFVNNIANSAGTALPSFVEQSSSKDSWDYNLTTGGGNSIAGATKLTIGTHNIAGVNPQFLDASIVSSLEDFALGKTSPALKAGLALSYSAPDITGTEIATGTRPNLGAYTH